MSVLCEYAAYFARCRIFAYFSKVRISQFFLHKLAFLTATTTVYNNNNNDRLTAFDPGQPG